MDLSDRAKRHDFHHEFGYSLHKKREEEKENELQKLRSKVMPFSSIDLLASSNCIYLYDLFLYNFCILFFCIVTASQVMAISFAYSDALWTLKSSISKINRKPSNQIQIQYKIQVKDNWQVPKRTRGTNRQPTRPSLHSRIREAVIEIMRVNAAFNSAPILLPVAPSFNRLLYSKRNEVIYILLRYYF